MLDIPLDNIPNQSFSMTIENDFYDMTIKETNGVMSCSIIRNNIIIQQGARMTSGYLLIPYIYQESGNFFMLTENDDYPYYDRFGIDQFLRYIPQSEINILRKTDINTIDTGF